MPAALLDPALKYLRLKCGLPTAPRPRPSVLDADPDGTAKRLQAAAEAEAARGVVMDTEPR